MQDNQQQHQQRPQPQQDLLRNSSNNDTIPYRNFIHSIKSPRTRKEYAKSLRFYMNWLLIYDYNTILQKDPRLIASDIIDFIIYLKNDRKLAPATINLHVAALHHFYEMNDVELRWSKIKSFKDEFHNVVEDRPYTREEIKLLVDRSDLRNKAIILLMASSGLRIGAIPELRFRDLEPIYKYNLYKITVYKRSKAKYTTFCTPECRKAIDDYMKWRESVGEQIKPDSPVFRKAFDRNDLLQVQNNQQPLNLHTINWILNDLLHSTGVRIRSQKDSSKNIKKERREVMQAHGFRKFFDTTCTLNGMDGLYVEKLMGHDIGLKAHYFKPSPQELLEGNEHKLGYVSVIDALTINDENRLRRENQILKVNKSEIEQLKEKAERYESFMATFNPQIAAFQREIDSLKLHLNSEANNKKKSKSSNKKETENITTDGA
jgi:integrase